MKFLRPLGKIMDCTRLGSVLPEWSLSRRIGWMATRPGAVSSSGSVINFPEFDLNLGRQDPRARWLIENFDALRSLRIDRSARFWLTESGLGVQVGDLQFELASANEISILHEVFGQEIYRFNLAGPAVMVDIGMNSGMASLDFLAGGSDRWAYGYELVPATAQLAERNRNMNPVQADRLQIHDFGLFDSDGTMSIQTSKSHPSINGLFEGFNELRDMKTDVRVVDVAVAVREIFDRHQDCAMVLKLDAEGAEYEIFERLEKEQLLTAFDVVMIEWHEREGRSVEEIRARLVRNGFRFFEESHPAMRVGLIRGFGPTVGRTVEAAHRGTLQEVIM